MRSLKTVIAEQAIEIARLKAGDFTPEEFQNLCHKMTEKDRKIFCLGCEDYHIKIFGSSPITEMREALRRLLLWAECAANRIPNRAEINWKDVEEARKVLRKYSTR